MKKYFWCILASLCCICLLFGCGSQEETKHEKKERKAETTTVEQIETTEKSTKKATLPDSVKTSKLQSIDLDNELQGPYMLQGIEFLAPSYMRLKEENEEFIIFSRDDIGDLRIL